MPDIKITKQCPRCDSDLIIRINKESQIQFVGCSQWPQCEYTTEIPESLRLRLMGAETLPGFSDSDLVAEAEMDSKPLGGGVE